MERFLEVVPPITWLYRDPSTLMTAVKMVKNDLSIDEVAVIGSATGEQVYSLQSLFHSAAKRKDITVRGYDVKRKVLDKATQAIYEPDWRILRNKRIVTLIKNILKIENDCTKISIPEEFKINTTFDFHNILHEPLDNPVPLIVCSNLLPYFITSVHQKEQPFLDKALYNLSQSLLATGYLITEPTVDAIIMEGSTVDSYIKYMEQNQFFLETPSLSVPIHDFIRYPQKIRFLSERTHVYRKKC